MYNIFAVYSHDKQRRTVFAEKAEVVRIFLKRFLLRSPNAIDPVNEIADFKFQLPASYGDPRELHTSVHRGAQDFCNRSFGEGGGQ